MFAYNSDARTPIRIFPTTNLVPSFTYPIRITSIRGLPLARFSFTFVSPIFSTISSSFLLSTHVSTYSFPIARLTPLPETTIDKTPTHRRIQKPGFELVKRTTESTATERRRSERHGVESDLIFEYVVVKLWPFCASCDTVHSIKRTAKGIPVESFRL